ncbi:hypothetical protein YB2330_006064 [Saitoella coloradoensis]
MSQVNIASTEYDFTTTSVWTIHVPVLPSDRTGLFDRPSTVTVTSPFTSTYVTTRIGVSSTDSASEISAVPSSTGVPSGTLDFTESTTDTISSCKSGSGASIVAGAAVGCLLGGLLLGLLAFLLLTKFRQRQVSKASKSTKFGSVDDKDVMQGKETEQLIWQETVVHSDSYYVSEFKSLRDKVHSLARSLHGRFKKEIYSDLVPVCKDILPEDITSSALVDKGPEYYTVVVTALLAGALSTLIFEPFHPKIALEQGRVFEQVYRNIELTHGCDAASTWRRQTLPALLQGTQDADASATLLSKVSRIREAGLHFFVPVDIEMFHEEFDDIFENAARLKAETVAEARTFRYDFVKGGGPFDRKHQMDRRFRGSEHMEGHSSFVMHDLDSVFLYQFPLVTVVTNQGVKVLLRAESNMLLFIILFLGLFFHLITILDLVFIQRRPKDVLDHSKWSDKAFSRLWNVIGDKIAEDETDDIKKLTSEVSGVVLDLGPGTGLMLRHLNALQCARVIGIEPNADFHQELLANAKRAGLMDKYTLIPTGVENLAALQEAGVGEGSVDCIITIKVLCTVPQQRAMIAHLYRFLKPGGLWLLYEHVESRDIFARKLQCALDHTWSKLLGGCHITRNTVKELGQTGAWESFVVENAQGMTGYEALAFVKGRLIKAQGT